MNMGNIFAASAPVPEKSRKSGTLLIAIVQKKFYEIHLDYSNHTEPFYFLFYKF
jgi:hypothetical protein